MEDDFVPPPYPPPFLKADQVSFLTHQGWLPLDLPAPLHSDLQNVLAAAPSFFNAGEDEKRAMYPSSRGTQCECCLLLLRDGCDTLAELFNIEGGYYVIPDEKEYVTFRHQQNPDLPLERHVRSAWKKAAYLLHRILCDLATFHGYNPCMWTPLMEGTFDLAADETDLVDSTTLARLFRYYPEGFAEEHTDIGLLTISSDDRSGLEVLDQYQEPPQWVALEGPVVLVADTASVLMNRNIRPGKHRVVGNPHGRHSITFALRPCMRAEFDLALFGGEGAITAREFFSRTAASRYNVNATKELREKQRQRRERWSKQQTQFAGEVSELEPPGSG